MNKSTKLAFILLAPLLMFSGCWQTGDAEYVGIVTKMARIGAVFQTWEGELHLVDAKGTMVADSVNFSVDASSEHGEDTKKIVNDLRAAQLAGTRVKITAKREMWVGCWRGDENRLVVSVELLP